MSILKRTALFDLHASLGAKFVEFAGYEMPVQYTTGLIQEHQWTRQHAGLFDVSHMGQLRARGSALHTALESALPIDFEGWPSGLQRYSLLLNERGGIDDDLMLLNLDTEIAIIVNAACRDHDLERLRTLCPQLSLEWREAALLALQGPSAESVLSALLGSQIVEMKFMHGGQLTKEGVTYLITRSGYTGEDGFEISMPLAHAEAFARQILEHEEVRAIGLGARDTLRLEAGLHLYGQDMTSETTPRTARLEWAIAKSRRLSGAKEGGFPGAATVLNESREGTPRQLAAFFGREAVPIRHGAEIVDESGKILGVVTSGTVSPTLQRPVMLGYVDVAVTPDQQLFAMVRGQKRAIDSTTLPFVPKRYKRT